MIKEIIVSRFLEEEIFNIARNTQPDWTENQPSDRFIIESAAISFCILTCLNDKGQYDIKNSFIQKNEDGKIYSEILRYRLSIVLGHIKCQSKKDIIRDSHLLFLDMIRHEVNGLVRESRSPLFASEYELLCLMRAFLDLYNAYACPGDRPSGQALEKHWNDWRENTNSEGFLFGEDERDQYSSVILTLLARAVNENGFSEVRKMSRFLECFSRIFGRKNAIGISSFACFLDGVVSYLENESSDGDDIYILFYFLEMWEKHQSIDISIIDQEWLFSFTEFLRRAMREKFIDSRKLIAPYLYLETILTYLSKKENAILSALQRVVYRDSADALASFYNQKELSDLPIKPWVFVDKNGNNYLYKSLEKHFCSEKSDHQSYLRTVFSVYDVNLSNDDSVEYASESVFVQADAIKKLAPSVSLSVLWNIFDLSLLKETDKDTLSGRKLIDWVVNYDYALDALLALIDSFSCNISERALISCANLYANLITEKGVSDSGIESIENLFINIADNVDLMEAVSTKSRKKYADVLLKSSRYCDPMSHHHVASALRIQNSLLNQYSQYQSNMFIMHDIISDSIQENDLHDDIMNIVSNETIEEFLEHIDLLSKTESEKVLRFICAVEAVADEIAGINSQEILLRISKIKKRAL